MSTFWNFSYGGKDCGGITVGMRFKNSNNKSTGLIPQGHLGMSEDVFVCHDLKG